MFVLHNGELIDPTAVEIVATSPWQTADGLTQAHRAVIRFKSGWSQEFAVDTDAAAVELRDAIIAQILAHLTPATPAAP